MELVGGTYEGDLKNGRIEGRGKYTFADGTVYEGEFYNGMFHGKGTLYLPGVGRYEAEWENGREVHGQYAFNDKLGFIPEGWGYCTGEDRRFASEIVDGLKPAGEEQESNSVPAPDLMEGCYDAVDGYYDPRENKVYDYNTHDPIRIPLTKEIEWMQKRCRMNRGPNAYK